MDTYEGIMGRVLEGTRDAPRQGVRTLRDGTRIYRDGRPRDSQRSRVYAAERAWAAEMGYPNRGDFADRAEVQAYVDRVTRSRWWLDRGGRRQITVSPGKKRGAFSYNGRAEISVPRAMMRRWVVLHELAHQLSPRHEASHGRTFARRYLAVVQHYLGTDAAKALRRHFREHKVRWFLSKGERERGVQW